MGGDARNTHYNASEKKLTVENAPMLQEIWTKTIAGYPPGSPLVVDGKVFVMATGGTYAFDLATGNQLWANLEIGGTASLAWDGAFIYAHANVPQRATLYKLNPADGKPVWGPVKTYDHVDADGTSSPIVGGGKVLVGHSTTAEILSPNYVTAHGGVFAAHTDSGMEAWHYWTTGTPDSPENGVMVWSSVSIHEGVVYASTGNNYSVAGANSDAIHAIDLATGVKKWVKQVRANDIWILGGAGEDTDFGANPTVVDIGGKKLVAAGDKASAFWALDRDTGAILWTRADLSPSHFAN
ncbi:MAG TPA: PQQ-binding-like beta-propeller repeat protein, partial [Polyangiales bacterium]|nr:PQQ-binding-like beta-propeller repeat protein [Polyangiales bacterium]